MMKFSLFEDTTVICETCEVLKKELAELKAKHCDTCEILKVELENERFEKRKLLDKLLFPPEEKREPINQEELKPVYPRHTPWSVQQALLEKEDREKAKIMAEFNKPEPTKTIEELEKALDIDRGPSGGIVAQVKPLTEKDFEEVNAS